MNYELRITSRAGFTAIELLVVLAVSVVLTTLLITTNRGSEGIVVLRGEQAKLLGAIASAKSLAIQTFVADPNASRACGYGVYFPGASVLTYTVFQDKPDPPTGQCVALGAYTGNKQFDSGEEVQAYALTSGVVFDSISISSVLFIPPDPMTVLYPSASEATVVLKLTDGGASAGVTVTGAGQITAE